MPGGRVHVGHVIVLGTGRALPSKAGQPPRSSLREPGAPWSRRLSWSWSSSALRRPLFIQPLGQAEGDRGAPGPGRPNQLGGGGVDLVAGHADRRTIPRLGGLGTGGEPGPARDHVPGPDLAHPSGQQPAGTAVGGGHRLTNGAQKRASSAATVKSEGEGEVEAMPAAQPGTMLMIGTWVAQHERDQPVGLGREPALDAADPGRGPPSALRATMSNPRRSRRRPGEHHHAHVVVAGCVDGVDRGLHDLVVQRLRCSARSRVSRRTPSASAHPRPGESR